jgi:L-ascorbate metabolism protein UlaG (beta-lactamase superfamily)
MMRTALPVALLVMIPMPLGPAPAGAQPARPPCGVRHVANAGLLFTSGSTRLLFDAPIRDGIPPYATSDADDRRRLEQGEPPFDRVDAVLVTHWHEDHFSAGAVAAHLQQNSRSVLVSSDEVVQRVRVAWPGAPAARLRGVTPPPGRSEALDVGGVRIHVLRIRHNPARRTPEQHVGFLVEGCRTLLHTGDADPEPSNFAVLDPLPRVEVAGLPFWYVSSERARAFVSASIRPGRVLALHVPPRDAAAIERQLEDLPFVVLLREPGQTVDLHDRR